MAEHEEDLAMAALYQQDEASAALEEEAQQAAMAEALAEAEAASQKEHEEWIKRKSERASAKETAGNAYLEALRAKERAWALYDVFEEHQRNIRTKQDIERSKRTMQADEIDEWRKKGVALGVLDADYQPVVAQQSEESHVPDKVVASEGVGALGDHHLSSDVIPMTDALAAAIAAAESTDAPQQKSKVI